ncbi:MAG TPA: hypothetical protein VKS21_13625, partial [Spirochaetota bacterium]|nr:hypothetical protein [Spirochaetota bacterium]
MKKIFFYFRDFFRQSFSPSFYIALALFTALILVINFSFNLENGIIDRRYYGTFLHFVFFFILNAFVYLVSVLFYTFFNKTGYLLQKKEFILKVLCFLVLITLKRSFYWHKTMIPARLCYQQWLVQIMQNAYGLVVVLLPLFLFYFFCEKNNKNFYGFNNKNFDFKPYFIILLTVAPVIAIASWSPSFTSYYPILKASENTSASLCLQVPEIVTAAFYEFFYLLDFLNTEILFRGFL